MTKRILFASALAVMMLGACADNNKSCSARGSDKDVMTYTGLLPAADVAGVRYMLTLDYDDDNAKGDYDLVEVYVASDTTSASGYRDVSSYKSEGDFTVIDGTGDKAGKKYLKLVKDAKDSSAGAVSGPLYFLVDSDSKLVMVNDSLQPSETPGLNYTLTIVE